MDVLESGDPPTKGHVGSSHAEGRRYGLKGVQECFENGTPDLYFESNDSP